jgi:hypothetical protein
VVYPTLTNYPGPFDAGSVESWQTPLAIVNLGNSTPDVFLNVPPYSENQINDPNADLVDHEYNFGWGLNDPINPLLGGFLAIAPGEAVSFGLDLATVQSYFPGTTSLLYYQPSGIATFAGSSLLPDPGRTWHAGISLGFWEPADTWTNYFFSPPLMMDITSQGQAQGGSVTFTMSSVLLDTPVPVPEPSTFMLLLCCITTVCVVWTKNRIVARGSLKVVSGG